MSDWADRLVKSKKEKREKEHVHAQLELENYKILQGSKEKLWEDMKKQAQALVDELNDAMEEKCLACDVSEPNKIFVRRPDSTSSLAHMSFDSLRAQLSTSTHGVPIELFVNSRKEMSWRSTATSDIWSSDSLVRQMIESAWKAID